MIIVEYFMTRRDGVELYRTYSNEGFMIERDGERYEEAIDPAGTNRVYTETDEKIEGWEPPVEESGEEQEEDPAEEPVEVSAE